ncbi:MAG: hypothetical protein Q8O09_01000 [Bacillota bacterium]|nr:hypothetical protein [Bacillota bacterium]
MGKRRKRNPAVWIAKTAVLLGLALLFQTLDAILPAMSAVHLGPFDLSTLIIGMLVNLTLCVAAGYAGFWSGVIIGVLTPAAALLQGQMAFAVMLPVVAAGNITIVTVFWLLAKKARFPGSMYVGAIAGGALKFGVMWAPMTFAILPALILLAPDAQKASVLSTTLTFSMIWAQLITGVAGGVIAAAIIPPIRRGLGEKKEKEEEYEKR